ncbi:MAG: hypothetical protein QOD78_2243 [Chloroflexota bacterium]|jgi:hypothetical protein|nr:hypothetical protein [Chloroflexota bacterium]
MAGSYGARLFIVVIGVLLFLSGLVGVAAGPALASSGIWAMVVGLVLVIAGVLERVRYRSAEAERSGAGHGPGGGEPITESLDPRFRPTDERFEDPTTRQRMRVWTDPTSGERRYVAED